MRGTYSLLLSNTQLAAHTCLHRGRATSGAGTVSSGPRLATGSRKAGWTCSPLPELGVWVRDPVHFLSPVTFLLILTGVGGLKSHRKGGQVCFRASQLASPFPLLLWKGPGAHTHSLTTNDTFSCQHSRTLLSSPPTFLSPSIPALLSERKKTGSLAGLRNEGNIFN